jgi:hypothetical protein
MICQKCKKELDDEAIVCTQCGCQTENKVKNVEIPEHTSGAIAFLTVLLSLFVPQGVIFGFVLWASKIDIQPRSARTYGLCAILPWFLKWFIPRLMVAIACALVVIFLAILVVLYYAGVIDLSAIMA